MNGWRVAGCGLMTLSAIAVVGLLVAVVRAVL
jgi:hypothetical protein